MLQIMLICSVLLLAPSLLIAQDGGLAAANSWLETHLADSQTSPLSYVFLFLGGIVASLLPCTYPLYPITANIIRSRSEHEKKDASASNHVLFRNGEYVFYLRCDCHHKRRRF